MKRKTYEWIDDNMEWLGGATAVVVVIALLALVYFSMKYRLLGLIVCICAVLFVVISLMYMASFVFADMYSTISARLKEHNEKMQKKDPSEEVEEICSKIEKQIHETGYNRDSEE